MTFFMVVVGVHTTLFSSSVGKLSRNSMVEISFRKAENSESLVQIVQELPVENQNCGQMPRKFFSFAQFLTLHVVHRVIRLDSPNVDSVDSLLIQQVRDGPIAMDLSNGVRTFSSILKSMGFES